MLQATKRAAAFVIWTLALLPGSGSAADGAADNETVVPDTLTGHGGPIGGIAIDPGSNRALTASFDYTVVLWTLKGREGTLEHRLVGHDAAVNDVAFVPGGERAVSVSDDGSTIVWDLREGTALKRLPDTPVKVIDVAVSPDGRYAAIARWDDTARLIDLDTLEEARRIEGHRGNVNAVAFGPAGEKTLYTGSYDGTIRAWDVETGSERGLVHDHGWGVNALQVVGETLVYGGLDGTLARMALRTREVEELAHFDSPVLSLALSSDGTRLAAGFGHGVIQVYGTLDWALLEQYSNAYGPAWGLAFADDAGTGLYHTGLDDFAAYWRVRPRAPFEQPKSVFPRRFQVRADMGEGELQFQRKCSVCHTLEADDKNRAGPTLYGLFGRKAGSVPGYPYSEGLRNSDIVWTEETVAKLFDHGPDVFTPGSKMPLQRLKDVDARDALIAFLKQATMPREQNDQQ